MTTKNGALFKSTLDVVTIALKYQLLTSSPDLVFPHRVLAGKRL